MLDFGANAPNAPSCVLPGPLLNPVFEMLFLEFSQRSAPFVSPLSKILSEMPKGVRLVYETPILKFCSSDWLAKGNGLHPPFLLLEKRCPLQTKPPRISYGESAGFYLVR